MFYNFTIAKKEHLFKYSKFSFHLLASSRSADRKGNCEGISKILRTGAAIYTAVVVARSTGRW
jgi:hypothetical protein